MPMIMTMLGRKGGIGRTTTSMNLAGVWAKEGLRVLAVDLDSQASLSRCLLGSEFVETTHPAETAAGVFGEQYDVDPEEVIHATQFDNLSVLPACDALEESNVTKPWKTGARQRVLANFFAEASDLFDVAIVDTGPNTIGLTAWAALTASHFVLSPVPCDSFGTQSIISVQRLTEMVQRSSNPNLNILGYFINMFQKNKVMMGYEETLRRVHGAMVLDTILPLTAAYRQAVAERTPLAMKKGNSKPVQVLQAFAAELNERICNTPASRRAA